ncbi:MAG TPA: mechanosensitive ion channel family protein [Reyranellaceae bacterium]|nr:mechanosensitive ion channel family protein [Reyranellaceae bacterium]
MTLQDILSAIERALAWLPDWAISAIVFALAASMALFLHKTTCRLLKRLVPSRHGFIHSLIDAAQRVIRVALVLIAAAVVLPLLPIDPEVRAAIGHGLIVAGIGVLGWSIVSAISLASDFYVQRTNVASGDVIGRKHITQVRILRRTAATVVTVLTIAAALMTFQSVKQYGVSLIASAGAAGIIVGLALRPLLTNLFAGIQIAITQPIRIGDEVIVEGEWGWVEEITGTYVVIKVWDWRRLVVPLSYFLEKPFQNWTRQSSEIIGTVLLWVDYTVPVAPVRAKLEEVVKESKLWDGQVVNLQVVESSERAVQLRALVSAKTAPQAWDLRCEVREKLIAFLQENYPMALPKQRNQVIDFAEAQKQRA